MLKIILLKQISMNRNMFGELKKGELDAIADSIKNKLVAYVNDGKKSFQFISITSLPLLHIIGKQVRHTNLLH